MGPVITEERRQKTRAQGVALATRGPDGTADGEILWQADEDRDRDRHAGSGQFRIAGKGSSRKGTG